MRTVMAAEKQDVLKRLHCIEGHVGGIGKMIEEESNCLDVLRQTYAVRKAIEKLEVLLVEQHMADCIHQRIASEEEEAVLEAFMQWSPLRGYH